MIADGHEEDIKRELASDPNVAYVEKDKPIHLTEAENDAARLATAPYFRDVLGLNVSNPDHEQVYNGSSPILVAVIDTGANMDHPFLAAAMSTNSAEVPNNGQDDDGNGFVDDVHGANVVARNGDYSDVADHGTHVSGLIKAVRDQAIAKTVSVSGSPTQPYSNARKIQILPIKFFYRDGNGSISGSTAGAILALEYALSRGAKVVNMSWGSQGADSYSQALFETLAELYANNVVLVAAAGNSAINTDTTPFFPSALNTSIPGLISVGSITTTYNSSNTLTGLSMSYFSNYGRTSVDVSAPGSMFLPSYDNYYAGLISANAYYPEETNMFVQKQGTSMAAPIISGIAAVVKSINSSLNAYDIKNLILESAVSISALTNKNRVNGYADAESAFEAAAYTETQGVLPASSTPVYSDRSFDSSSTSTGGGCGAMITPNSGSGGGNNPFGGNSLGLFTALYFLVQFAKRMRYKLN